MNGIRVSCLVFVCLLVVSILPSPAAAQGEYPTPQVVQPITNQTPQRDPNEVYVPPSATVPLTPGVRLDLGSDFELWTQTPFAIQRLTDRTYFVATNVYSSTVYVGNSGVLVIDCGGHNGGQPGPEEAMALVEAIGTITPLPIKTLVYSHPHTDHVGNSVFLKQMFPNLEIVASQWAAEQIEMFDYPIAPPTKIVYPRNGKFQFEGNIFRLVTPVPVAHTPADSYVVTPDRVLHVVDFVHAGRLTFVEASVVQNLDGFVLFLRHLAGERDNYDFLNPGHMNIAYARDVDQAIAYYQALYAAWWETLQEMNLGQFIDPNDDNAVVWIRNFFDAVAERMFEKVAPAYGHVRFFEVARDHAAKVHENQFLHRLSAVDQAAFGSIPDFAPVAPEPPAE